MTYKQAQIAYGIQGKSTVLVWLRKHGNLNWDNPQTAMGSKAEEPPAQRIIRLEKLVEDEKLKNTILNGMIDIIDNQYRTGLRKKYLSNQSKKDNNKEKISLSRCCRLFGISRQAIYQALDLQKKLDKKLGTF